MSNRFFIIGAQRSATTYLYHLLAEHPEIEMARPLRPEPKFFLQENLYTQGLEFYETCYFPGKNGAWLKGEKSTSYLEYTHVAERLAISYPEAIGILVLMRDPIDRALSNYLFSHSHGLETLPLEEALLLDPETRIDKIPSSISVNPFAYLARGRYMDYLSAYDCYFPPEQVYGMLKEQLLGNLNQIQALYAFLGVSSDFLPTGLYDQINANDEKQTGVLSPWLQKTLIDYFAEANGRLEHRFDFGSSAMVAIMPIKIPFNRPSLAGNEYIYMQQAIEANHLSGDGIFTKKCHAYLENAIGVSKVLLTTSCTHALEMTALLLNIHPGDEIIMPSFTFVSTANAFVLRGARPVFVDIRSDTLNMDENQLERHITPRTKAIVPVHYVGIGYEMDDITKLAQYHNITIIEDAAHGLFGKYKGRALGTFGAMATQSFHDTKNFTCGEGGALLINDPQFIEPGAEIHREKGTDRSRYFRGQVDNTPWLQQALVIYHSIFLLHFY